MSEKKEYKSSIIKEFSEKIDKIKKKFDSNKGAIAEYNAKKEHKVKIDIIKNKDWLSVDHSKLKIIYCGDNPGKNEVMKKSYFVGKSGSELDLFIKTNNYQLEIKEGEYTFFNKTVFSSQKTKDITDAIDDHSYIQESIKEVVMCFYNLHNRNEKLQFYIFGIDKGAYIVSQFIKEIELLNDLHFNQKFKFLKHPSRGHLFKSIGRSIISSFEDKKDKIEIDYTKLISKVEKKDMFKDKR
jgi:hypothetical protein